MKKRLIMILLSVFTALIALFGIGCGKSGKSGSDVDTTPKPSIDYAGQVTLDRNSNSKTADVTVKLFVDGDTTHFYCDDTTAAKGGIVKARYAAVNTPESTGQLEEWGKAASKFTKSKLSSATSIVIQSDGEDWEYDSTGERRLLWVWYMAEGSDTYRNLNLELLQNGLAVGSKASSTRYGEAAVAAIDQATREKLHVHSGEKDPDFFYGGAITVDLKELRLNLAKYKDKKVSFDGYVSQSDSTSAYVENFDEETQRWYGMYVYFGYNLSPAGQKILSAGNHVRIVGNLQYYEAGNSYQIANLFYDPWQTSNPDQIKKLDKEVHPIANPEITMEKFNEEITFQTTVVSEDGEESIVTKTAPYCELAVGTSISMKNLKVVDAYTTKNPDSDNYGAISLTCTVDGQTITVRTSVLYDADKNMVKQDIFEGKTIDVKGVIDYYLAEGETVGTYQIKLFSINNVVFH